MSLTHIRTRTQGRLLIGFILILTSQCLVVLARPTTTNHVSDNITPRLSPSILFRGKGKLSFERIGREAEFELTERLADRSDDPSPPATEPLSIQHGNVLYSVNNSTDQKVASFIAFHSLRPSKSNTHFQLDELPSEQRKVKGFHKNRNRVMNPVKTNFLRPQPAKLNEIEEKPPLEGRKDALMSLADARSVHKAQKCEGQKFKQRVKIPGCLTKVIVNRFCHGTCSSFFIPRMKAKKLKAVFQSCAACAPVEYDSMDVTLECPGMDPPQITKSVIMIKSCACKNIDLSNVMI